MNFLITGTTGIAQAAADMARSRGDRVFTIGLEDTADFQADLRDEAQTEAAVAAAATAMDGRIDGLFNVAGMSGRRFGDGPLDECTLDAFRATIEANAVTVFLINRAIIRHWLARSEKGAIVNLGSVLIEYPEPAHFATHAYGAAKGGVIAMTRAAASYYAPKGIRMNIIAPGLVRTPMTARAQTDPVIMDFMARKQPLSNGILDADDIASAALFLLGKESKHITGQVLSVDGGWSLS
ncbi:hypothetical protein F183_A27440 [Bryobacterales bacterium F-183]|nr:hypothetical protein F183_A27440 [Bryobacterales bacterium F-183]